MPTMLNYALSGTPLSTASLSPAELSLGQQDVRALHRQPSRAADILTLGENPTLAIYLAGLFQQSEWRIAHAHSCADGVSFLQDSRAAVAVCEEALPDGTWCDAAAAFHSIADAPALVVIGDNPSLLEEALALGGFDALIRPLRESDVVWTIASAWHAWMNRFDSGGKGAPSCSGA
jgi:DNA-binding NtrC family response regulator